LALLVGLFALAWSIDDLPTNLRMPAVQLHMSLGITVLGLTILRLAWRFAVGVPALPGDLPAWQRLAARANEFLLYLLLLAQALVGWLWTSAGTKAINYFFLVELPWLIGPDKPLSRTLGNLHGLIGNLLLIVIGLHAAAALYHHFVRRDRVLLGMLRG
jgi:cytochrome b561